MSCLLTYSIVFFFVIWKQSVFFTLQCLKNHFLGIHLEGPFISTEKRGAHPAKYIQNLCNGFDSLLCTFQNLENVSIVTLAPEGDNCMEVVRELTDRGIKVSLGNIIKVLSVHSLLLKICQSFIVNQISDQKFLKCCFLDTFRPFSC